MIVGLNLLHANLGIGGVWDYIKGIMFALGKYDQENQYICYCTSESECLVPKKKNFTIKKIMLSSNNRIKRIVYENTLLPIRVKKDRLDCLHWFANTLGFFCPVPSVVTIYDLLIYEITKNFSFLRQIYLKTMLPRSVRLASVLAPMSKSTANAIFSILKGDYARMLVIPPMVADEFRPASREHVEKFRAKYRLPDEFWLYVAHFYPHKNHSRLFQAYTRIKDSGANQWPLVLRGENIRKDGQIERFLNETGMKNDIILLPRLSDGEMPLLFSSASALVFPSIIEGGGIPVLEAMACGCPVTASHIPTNIEFAGDAALLFDPLSVEAIAEAMQRFGCDTKLREKHRQLGLKKVEKLRPYSIAKLLESAYEKACRK